MFHLSSTTNDFIHTRRWVSKSHKTRSARSYEAKHIYFPLCPTSERARSTSAVNMWVRSIHLAVSRTLACLRLLFYSHVVLPVALQFQLVPVVDDNDGNLNILRILRSLSLRTGFQPAVSAQHDVVSQKLVIFRVFHFFIFCASARKKKLSKNKGNFGETTMEGKELCARLHLFSREGATLPLHLPWLTPVRSLSLSPSPPPPDPVHLPLPPSLPTSRSKLWSSVYRYTNL